MDKITFKIEGMDDFLKKVGQLPDTAQKKVSDLVKECGLNMQSEAVKNLSDNHSVITKMLLDSLLTGLRYDYLSTTLETAVEYAPYVEYGTAPHSIDVKNASVLATKSGVNGGGQWIYFGKHVDHPGSHAKPFFNPAFETARNRFLQGLKQMFP